MYTANITLGNGAYGYLSLRVLLVRILNVVMSAMEVVTLPE
jgi:hypothetical protein